ncbi:MAG: hypothetical protein ACREKG_04385 [Candidatus Rokuibacteriota bacterium]
MTGATARDILLVGVFGLETGRGTRDVDLAIAVDGWPQFEMVKTRLVESGTFKADDRVTHRLFHLSGKGRRGYQIDLIPCGGIEDPAATIAWPPERIRYVLSSATFGYGHPVTARFATASLPEDAAGTGANLFRHADQRLRTASPGRR